MTVETEVTRVIVAGNAVTTVFSYTFPIPGSTSTDQTNAELLLLGTDSSITVLADNLWSITGVDTSVGGTFTYSPAITTGAFLILNRIVPYEQTTSLSAQGAYSPEVVEAALDNLAFQTEQLNTRALQAVRAPIVDAALSDLPTAEKRANSFLYFDDNGDVTTASSTGGMPSSIFVGSNSTTTFHTQTMLLPGATVTSDGSVTTVSVGGSITVSDGISTVSGATSLVFTGATVGGSTPNATVAISGSGGGSSIPQGRLTLTAGTPVMTADNTSSTTVHYCTYQGNQCPVYDGSVMQSLTIPSDDISVILDATNQPSGFLYDVFAWSNSGVLALGIAGQGWVAGNQARHTGAGSSELQLKLGVWTNKNGSLPLLNNGSTVATVAANKATYLGTFYAISNGHTAWICNPAAADAGGNNILGLYNAYQRVPVMARGQDSRASWTYSTATWRPSDNSANNRITYVDGLAQSFVDAFVEQAGAVDTGSSQAQVGVNLDSVSATPTVFGICNATVPVMFTVRQSFAPALGLHYVQSMERCDAPGTATFYANGAVQMMIAELEM